MSPRAAKVAAVVLGACCHVAFAAAVATMAFSLQGGMRAGLGRLDGTAALVANAALLLQFPLLHSFLLSRRGQRLLDRLAPAPLGAHLRTTTFALVASIQLLATFLLWSPSGRVWWSAAGAARWALSGTFASAWLLLLLAMRDQGLAVQTGSLGWTSVLRGRAPEYGPMPERGLLRVCRQPVYVAFALILWTVPTWSPDSLVVALTWTAYCAIGPLHKEVRYARRHGAAFDAYRERVPYWLPFPRPSGASSLASSTDSVPRR